MSNNTINEEVTSTLRNRFKDANWFGLEEPILIGGAGGIGSWFAFFAARAGFPLFLHDYDIVEEHNIGGQMFKVSDVGKLKTKSVQDICNEYSDNRVTIINEEYTNNSEANHIMIGAFDNMKARKTFFKRWKDYVLSIPENMRYKCLLIDGRLEAETWQIFCITPETMDQYETEGLFEDSEVTTEASCTLKQTSHMAAMIGSNMLGFLTNFLSNTKLMANIRKVPYFTRFSMAMGYYNSKSTAID